MRVRTRKRGNRMIVALNVSRILRFPINEDTTLDRPGDATRAPIGYNSTALRDLPYRPDHHPMSPLSVAVISLGMFGSSIWILFFLYLIAHPDDAASIASFNDPEPPGGWPAVALIFAARDEAGMVGRAARSMLAQDYPNLEVIAVDDRSVDATGAILDAIAAVEPRLRVAHVRDLPPGWLGKTNALREGAAATSAPWLLFTDADVVFRPDVVRRAIAFAEAEKADHVAVLPEVPTDSAGERLFLSLFGLLFSLQALPPRIPDRRSKAHAGVGAFNLVRAEPFRAIGGLRRVALSVDDDMRLAQALKFAGYVARVVPGTDAVSVRWQVGFGGYIRGLEKNFFAALDFRFAKVAQAVLGITALAIAPHAGLFVGPAWSRVVCGLGVAAVAGLLALTSRHSRIAWYYAAALPLAGLMTLVALGRSVVLTLARGGVRWRGHLYPLRELKDHVRLRDAWMREVWRSTR